MLQRQMIMGGGGVETSLDRFNNLVEIDYKEFANSVNLKEEVEAFTKLQSLQNELARLYSLRDIANKSVVAVGGGFSAGKSQFVSSFFKDNTIELPIGINPVTAISTYIINGDKHLIKGYTYKGGVVDIPIPLYKNLSHDFLKALGFNLKDILPMVAMETSIPDFTHICFVDTPGYNPAKTGTTSKDSNTAKEALENANALVWLVGLDATGTIPASDLSFLDSLDLEDKKLYIVVNKADMETPSRLENILDHFEDILDERGLEYEGISAYNSIDKVEITYRHTPLRDFLYSVDKDIVSKDKLAKDLNEIFLMYKNTLLEQKSEKDGIKRLLHSLELDIMQGGLDIKAGIDESIQTIYKFTNTKDIEKSLKDLKILHDSLFNTINDIFQDIFENKISKPNFSIESTQINTTHTKEKDERVKELLQQAKEAYKKGNYKEAADYYTRVKVFGVDVDSKIQECESKIHEQRVKKLTSWLDKM